MVNICYCGTQASYPHEKWCPYPLYRGSEAQEEAWVRARDAKIELLKEIEASKDPIKQARATARYQYRLKEAGRRGP